MELGFNGKEIARQEYHENTLSKARQAIATSFGNNIMNNNIIIIPWSLPH